MGLDICYIASHGFAARMLTQTGLLSKLSDKGLKVGLITVDKNDKSLVLATQNSDIELIEFNFRNNFWTENYKNKRKYLFEDIESNPALWEKHLKAVKSNKSKHPWRQIRPYYNFWLYKRIKKSPWLRDKYRSAEKRRLKSPEADRLLTSLNPKLLIATYPVAWQEATLLHSARNQGIKTVIHLLSWDNITCKGRFAETADEYIVWGPIMKEELLEFYDVDPSIIHMTGVPHFDLHYQQKGNDNYRTYVEELGLDSEKPYLFFAMSSPYFAPREVDIVERLTKDISREVFGHDLQLIVRPHPQNMQGHMMDKSWLPRLKNLDDSLVKVDYPELNNESRLNWSMEHEDMIRLSALLSGSSLVLNSGSTVSIDALMAGAPVVITSFDDDQELPYWNSAKRLIDFPHLAKLVAMGGVQIASSYMILCNLIERYLNNKESDLEARELAIKKECLTSEGRATEMVIVTLIKLFEGVEANKTHLITYD